MINMAIRRTQAIPLLLGFVLLTTGPHAFGQDSSWVYGVWRIEYMAFVSPPPTDELEQVVKACRDRKLTITKSSFTLHGSWCSLLRSQNRFKITKQYTLRSDDTSLNVHYAQKTIDYLFDGGKRKSITACKTNYCFESNEGDVPELEIFIVDRNHLILNQDEMILVVKRD